MALFKKMSPHDQYGQRLKDAGLDRTVIGSIWLGNTDKAFNNILNITLPYQETGYFDAAKTPVTAMRFDARRGQKLHISLTKKPALNFMIFADLFRENTGATPKLQSSVDTATNRLDFDVNETGKYIIRLQPELLRSGEYTLTITTGPSLNFPVSATGKPHIESFWGANRDEGARKHEGIDIFAPKGTPAIAAANGTITSVSENKLGGLVVMMRPDEKDYTLYYAHLSKQIAHDGQAVKTGDTLGLVGNTGNAAGGPTHLHFGIYTFGGAIDPLPFVDREAKQPKPVTANTQLLNATIRVKNKSAGLYVEPSDKSYARQTLRANTILTAEAATDGWFKVWTPGGQPGFIAGHDVIIANMLRQTFIKTNEPLLDTPNSIAPHKQLLKSGDKVEILGTYKNFELVKADEVTGWISVR